MKIYFIYSYYLAHLDLVKGIKNDCNRLASKNASFNIPKEELPSGRYEKIKISCDRKIFSENSIFNECYNKDSQYECVCNELDPGTEYNVKKKELAKNIT